tara:strand:+ start:1061 stop:1342 length:282 start_codon:yes stop_codon:yes gene_type:complete
MAYKRDLSKPLAQTFGDDGGDGDYNGAPNSRKIGKGLLGLGLGIFGANIALKRDKRKAEKNEALRKKAETKKRKAKFLKKHGETVKSVSKYIK